MQSKIESMTTVQPPPGVSRGCHLVRRHLQQGGSGASERVLVETPQRAPSVPLLFFQLTFRFGILGPIPPPASAGGPPRKQTPMLVQHRTTGIGSSENSPRNNYGAIDNGGGEAQVDLVSGRAQSIIYHCLAAGGGLWF